MGEEPGAPSTPASLLLLMFIPLFMPWRLIPRTPASFMLGHGLRGGGNGGVFKSTNGGGTWSAINTGLTATDVSALAIDPSNTSIVYSGTYGGGAFKSQFLPIVSLNISKSGTGDGRVTSDPSGINCGSTCTGSYNQGTSVTLTATPSSGSIFLGWSGACSGTGNCVFIMDSNKTVTATFNLQAQYSLSVVKAGTGGGAVTSTPAGISCGSDCSEAYNQGTVVTLTAAPLSGSTFTGWSGGGCSGIGICSVTMNANTTVTATFSTSNPTQYTLTVTKSGAGTGTVTSAPAGINCGSDCSEAFNQGMVVTLTAAPLSGSTFTGWFGGGCSGSGICSVTMNANTTVTAAFSISTPTQYTLTVTKSGAGTGTVTSSPAGINCGSDCSEQFKAGKQVKLTAKADTNSTFQGWSGAGCSGTGTCQITMNLDATVTANFAIKTKPLKLVRLNSGGILVNVHNPRLQPDGTVLADLALVNKTGTWYYVTTGGSMTEPIDMKIPSKFMLGPKDIRYYNDIKFNRADNLIIEASKLGPAVAAVSMDIIIRGCFGWKLPNNAFDTLMDLFEEGMDQVKPELDALMQAVLKKELIAIAKALANLIANVYARTPFVNILHVLLGDSFTTLGTVVEQGFQFLIDVIDLPNKIKLLFSLTKDYFNAPPDGESIIKAE